MDSPISAHRHRAIYRCFPRCVRAPGASDWLPSTTKLFYQVMSHPSRAPSRTPLFHARRSLAHLFVVSLLATVFRCFTVAAESPDCKPEPAPQTNAVTVTSSREGDTIKLFVENEEYCEVTMTFDMSLTHLKGDVQFPYTGAFPARQKTEAFTLSPDDNAGQWSFSYTNSFKLGSHCAKHDDNCVYQLPYGAGDQFKVTQGYNGGFSHKGSNKYAIDWKMPEGTLVHATRGGTVVKVKDDSNTGGSSMKFDRFNNFVLIRHDDGTLGHYCHLLKDSVQVKPGQTVTTGDVLAKSGNTGFSSGPHLHFCVFKTKNGRERESIPVKFRTTKDKAVTLMSGRSYRAVETQNVGGSSGNTQG
jgi:murein DD-endopeptidase MepM/ murein hydrolase activator NlpD